MSNGVIQINSNPNNSNLENARTSISAYNSPNNRDDDQTIQRNNNTNEDEVPNSLEYGSEANSRCGSLARHSSSQQSVTQHDEHDISTKNEQPQRVHQHHQMITHIKSGITKPKLPYVGVA